MAFPRRSVIDRSRSRGGLSTLLIPLLLLGSGVRPADGQLLDRVVATPTFGVVALTGDIADYLSPGPSFGLQVMYQLSPRLAAGVDATFDSHEGTPSPHTIFNGPPTQVLRYGIGAEFALLPPRPGSFTASVGGGAGLATMFSEKMYDIANPGGVVAGPGQTEHAANPLQFKGSYPAFNGLLRLAYVADPSITLFLEGIGILTNVDETKTVVFVQGPYPVARVGETKPIEFDEVGPLRPPSSFNALGVRVGLRKSLGL